MVSIGTGKLEYSIFARRSKSLPCVTPTLRTNSVKQCGLTMTSLQSDVLQLSKTLPSSVEGNDSKKIAALKQRIYNANTLDDFTILGIEISRKCTEAEKAEIIPIFRAKKQEFYENYYQSINISPQNIFEENFRKKLTQEEVDLLCAKYKDIIEETDMGEYVRRLFEQVKKDLGLDYLPIELKVNELEGIGSNVHGAMSACLDSLVLEYYKDDSLNRIGIFSIMMHELNHAKQSEISIATDCDAYLNAVAFRVHQNPMNWIYSLDEIKDYTANKIGAQSIADIKNKYGEIQENSDLYNLGMAYISGKQNYETVEEFSADAFRSYKKQFIEKESYQVQYNAGELYYYLTHVE